MNALIASAFDAQALGVTAVRLTVEPAENQPLTLMADVVMQCHCPNGPSDCVDGGRYTLSACGVGGRLESMLISESSTITAQLADFAPESLGESLLGSHPLAEFLVHLDPIDEPLEYEFCVSDVEFLDAAGDVVRQIR